MRARIPTRRMAATPLRSVSIGDPSQPRNWQVFETVQRFPSMALQDIVWVMQKLRMVWMLALGGVSAWSADWLTDGGNVQRTAWQREEKLISTATAKDIKLLWKLKLDNEPRVMHSLFPPLIVSRVNMPGGPKEIAIEAGS